MLRTTDVAAREAGFLCVAVRLYRMADAALATATCDCYCYGSAGIGSAGIGSAGIG